MPSSTDIVQLLKDLRERKSTVAHKFDDCYQKCSTDASYKASLVAALDAWERSGFTPATLPKIEPEDLDKNEKAHVNEWPDPEKQRVKNAIVNALNNDHQLEFFWDLNEDVNAATSTSKIEPSGAATAGNDPGGKVTVIFVTPRKNAVVATTPTLGVVKVHVTSPPP